MQYLHSIWFMVLLVLAWYLIRQSRFFYHRRVHPLFFEIIFLAKVVAGIIMTLIYTHFYTDRSTADIFKYFDDSAVMWQAIENGQVADFLKMITGIDSNNPNLDVYYRQMISWDESETIYNDSRIVIRFNALIRFISFGNYYIHMLVICLATLTGLTGLFHVLAQALKEKFMLIFCSVFLWPSVIFWYSGVLKDGLLISALGLFMFCLFNYKNVKHTGLFYFMFFISGVFLILIKTYVLLMILPGLLLIRYSKLNQEPFVKGTFLWSSVYIVWFAAVSLLLNLIFNQPVTEILAHKQQSFIQLAKDMNAGSYFEIPPITDFLSIIINAPQAFFNVLLRPYYHECRSPLMLMAYAENLVLIIMAVYTFIFRNKSKLTNKTWLLFSITFSVLLFMLIGLLVPVTGAIVRYKITALPFLALVMVICVDKEHAKKHLRFLRIIK